MLIGDVKQLNIPKSPGSYQFLDKDKKIIYIGKAADLRSRVLSYWRKSANHSPVKYSMMKQIKNIKWIETDSEIEALLLEANLIKKYQPSYNVTLRDDKRYVYIKVSTEEEWPRVFMTRNLDKSGKYFGPFVSTEAVRETLKVLRKIWPYRSCKNLPKKVCLYYRIGKCPGMCEGYISKVEYQGVVRQIISFLNGNKKEVISDINREIKNEKLKIKNYKEGSKKYLELEDKVKNLEFKIKNLNKVLENNNILSLVDKYASDVVELAKVLGLPKVPERIEAYDISNIFGKEAVGSMAVFSGGEPNKNEYRKFKIKIGEGQASDVRMLAEVLERRFKRLEKVTGEVKDKDHWPAPDLIIIDGGKAQLNVVLRVLKKYKLASSDNLRTGITAISISKGAGLRSAKAPDKIFFPGEAKPLELPLASPALHLVKRARDEAHRFAIEYHRKLRRKRFLK